ncbi:MAG: M56 family metallopeptidase [Lachnospiraceae bacterium]|nr:M56 family metallopeptidase [Lachnospiraceae bacterium]
MRTLLQMSLTGCYCVPLVLIVRFLLIRVLHSPRRYAYYLWLVVFLNLCLPFSFKAPVSLMPGWLSNPAGLLSMETESGGGTSAVDADNDAEAGDGTETAGDTAWAVDQLTSLSSGTGEVREEENEETNLNTDVAAVSVLAGIRDCIGQIRARIGNLMETVNRKAAVILSWPGLFAVWPAGLFLMLFYQGIVTFKMHRLLRAGHRVKGEERIYIVRNLSSPCLWELLRPAICLPEGLEESELDYILCHERCHKKRGRSYRKMGIISHHCHALV